MIDRFREALKPLWAGFDRQANEHLSPYLTFTNYRKIWLIGTTVLVTAALVPLIVVTIIHYRLIQQSVDSELILRTERLASNARRGVAFFLEERLNALQFTVNEFEYAELTYVNNLNQILRNLKLGFGGLSDLSVIDDTGRAVSYAGPFDLRGKDYSRQQWFIECKKCTFYVSEIFRGYRDVPHIIIAVKSQQENGRYFILRATLETPRLIQTLSSFETGPHTEIFLINRSGIIQTPSKSYGETFEKLPLPVPAYSPRTKAVPVRDEQGRLVVMGYAFISTSVAETPFIALVIKRKAAMMEVWEQLHRNINWIVGFGILGILVVMFLTSSFVVNKLHLADKAKAETMALMEENNQLASIGQLAAGVAHEINNPLALINETAGYIKDLFVIKEQYSKDDELIENIDSILDAVERCGTITRQLLGFARKFDVRIQKINLKDVISDVLAFHAKEAGYRDISVNVSDPPEDVEIETDRGKLQQILLNLVNNAFQAVSNGGRLDIHFSNHDRDTVKIGITDNGCGMSTECVANIFEPFFTTKERGKGTGLGLTITYGLVRKLQGSIEVESRENEGATFTITLPKRIQTEVIKNENSAGG